MKFSKPLLVATVIAGAATHAKADEVTDMITVLEQVFVANDCVFSLDRFEATIGPLIATELGVTPEAVLDRDGDYYDLIDTAFETMTDSGTLLYDIETEQAILAECPATN